MRRFTSEYLAATRDGMWEDSRAALEPLDLPTREAVLDVGAGSGELTAVLRAEAPGRVTAVDADRDLLAAVPPPTIQADATRLPVVGGRFDLVVCQALLVNLPDPGRAVHEFRRASRGLVAVIEPDNSAVDVESSVDAEERLASRARDRYLEGVETDATLGAVEQLFADAGLQDLSVTRYEQELTVDGPYSERDVEAARRKATGAGLDSDRETIISGSTTPSEYDDLRQAWRAMGRTVVDQMQAGTYARTETIPFYVTAGRVP